MTQQSIFWCGFGGSIAVEIVLLNQFLQTDSGVLPARYKNPVFWVVRILVAVVGGGLALAYEIDKALLAANIGAATPLIIKAFSEGIRPSIQGGAANPTLTTSDSPPNIQVAAVSTAPSTSNQAQSIERP